MLLLCLIVTASNAEQPVFLAPDKAFVFDVVVRDAHTLQASFNVSPGYYLYRDKIEFSIQDGAAKIVAVNSPMGEMTHDPYYGDVEVLRHSFVVDITLKRARLAATGITLYASYYGCSDGGLCYPPINKVKQLKLPVARSMQAPASPHSSSRPQPNTENSRIAKLFKEGDFWLIVSFFFGAGLLLSFTPCVFPMIPILSGIIVGRGDKISRAHAFILSLAYVLGMATTFAAAGVAAGFTGNLISIALQTPWVLGSFAGLFVLLSLSMFGLYELQLPNSWQSKLSDSSNKLHGGHLGGVFVMGALSAVIMGPCVTAPLAGALLYVSQTHDAILGGVALFVLALGMGAMLLLVGTSAGVLFPKTGEWMNTVKRLFGVLLLALAIWIIQPLVPISIQMVLWASLLPGYSKLPVAGRMKNIIY